MKRMDGDPAVLAQIVAPRTGAWIETQIASNLTYSSCVAPRTGAWIETVPSRLIIPANPVTPRTGAWIETREITG